jgi:alpha-tubulin suppressor-like RCC1 family protein
MMSGCDMKDKSVVELQSTFKEKLAQWIQDKPNTQTLSFLSKTQSSTHQGSSIAIKKWMVSGRNDFGQLGLGHQQSPVTTWTEFIPKQQFQQISSSTYSTDGKVYDGGFSVAVGVDGSVWSWGSNQDGQLGLGSSVSLKDVISSPQKISFFNEKQDPVITIHAGYQHAGVVTSMPFISI